MSGNAAHKDYMDAAFNGAREAGASVEKAAKAIGRSRSTGDRIVKRVRQATLTAPSAVNAAARTIKNFAKGQAARPGQDAPPPSVTLAAAKEITDRAEPKVNMNQNLNLNVSISPVDLSKYKD